MPSADLPTPRGPITRWLFSHLRGGAAGPRPEVTVADAGTDDDLQLALYCCYELHYRGFRGVDPELEWDLDVLALRADARGRASSPTSKPSVDTWRRRRPAGAEPPAGAGQRRATGRRCRPRCEQAALDGAGAGVLHPPLGVPAQGSRPAHLGDPPLAGRGEGGARSRSRPTSTATAMPAPMHAELFADTMRALGARPDLRRLPRPPPRRHPGHDQPDLAVRPAPPLARRAGRPPRPVRDDLGRPDGPLRRRPRAARRRRRGPRASTRCTSRRTRSTSTSRSSGWSVACCATNRSSPATSCSAPTALTEVEGRFADHLRTSWREGRSSLRTTRDAAEPMHAHTA